MKKILGIIILVVAVSYMIDGFGQILVSGYNSSVVSAYVGWLEALLPIWLLIKGRKVDTIIPFAQREIIADNFEITIDE